MWGLDHKEGWMLKDWCFWMWCWRRLLKVPWTARRSNQSMLKEVNPEYSLEGLMLKLKLQNFGHLMRRADSSEKTLMLGKIEGRKRRGTTEGETAGRHHWLSGYEFEQTSADSDGQGAWHAAVHGDTKSQTWLSDGTTDLQGGEEELRVSCIKTFPMRLSSESSWVVLERWLSQKGCESSVLPSRHTLPGLLYHASLSFMFYNKLVNIMKYIPEIETGGKGAGYKL